MKRIVMMLFLAVKFASSKESFESEESKPPLLYAVLASAGGGIIGAFAGGVTGLIVGEEVEKEPVRPVPVRTSASLWALL